MKFLFAIVLCSILLGCVFGEVEVVFDLDEFTINSDNVAVRSTTPQTESNFVQDESILGGERDLQVNYISGTGTAFIQASVANGFFSAAAPSTSSGNALLQYDGADEDIALNPIGLNGADFTVQDAFAFRLVVTADLDTTITLTVYTDASNFCDFEIDVNGQPEVLQQIDVNFSAFTNVEGTCDFTDVGAFEVLSDLPVNVDVEIDEIGLIADVPSPSRTPTPSPSRSPIPTSVSPTPTRTPSSSITPSTSRIPPTPSATPSPSSCFCTCPELECYMFKIGEYTVVGERNDLKRNVVEEEEGFDFLKFF